MIEVQRVTARDASANLSTLTVEFGPGMHALLGRKEDGPVTVLSLLAGRTRARAGTIRLSGLAPRDPALRRMTAYVPMESLLPDALRVDEVLNLAARIRGEAPTAPAKRLDVLGISRLADRKTRTLAKEEARAVALSEAISSNAAILLIEEPYVCIDPRAASMLGDALRARAHAGATIVFATASVRDASDLGEDVLVFDRGSLIRRMGAGELLASGTGRGARLVVACSDARALVAELIAERDIDQIETRAKSLSIRGASMVELATALGRAIVRAKVNVDSIRADAAPLSEIGATPGAPLKPLREASADERAR